MSTCNCSTSNIEKLEEIGSPTQNPIEISSNGNGSPSPGKADKSQTFNSRNIKHTHPYKPAVSPKIKKC